MGADDEKGEKGSRLEALWYRADAWEEARRFYREVVGLKEVHVDTAEGWTQFSTDAGPAIHVMRGGLPGQPPGVPVVGLRDSELETLHERLLRAGVEVDVRQGALGITRLRFVDPEGHRFAAYRWEIKDAVKPIAVRGMATDGAGRILVVQVDQSWRLPGGVDDDDEGPLETLEREFMEEVGSVLSTPGFPAPITSRTGTASSCSSTVAWTANPVRARRSWPASSSISKRCRPGDPLDDGPRPRRTGASGTRGRAHSANGLPGFVRLSPFRAVMLSRHLGVVGAGTMGSGIAETAITHGFEVILYDVAAEILARAHERIQSSLDRQARRGRVTPAEAQAVLARLHLSTRLEDLGAAGLIIEAAPEDLALKRGLFAALDRIASPQTILASNTSSLSITALAEATRHPQRVVGMHFFNPAPVMPLVEVIPGRATAPEVVGEAMAAARGLGKTPVEARDTPGFIVNRIARPFYLEALRLLDEGVAPVAEIDRIVRLAGRFRMGPFELLDLIGLDVNLAVTRSVYEAFSREPRFRPHPLQEQMVQAGRLGRKSGRGFYVYGEEGGPDGESAAPPPAPILRDPQRVVVIGAGGLAEGFQAAAQAAGWTVTVFPADPFVLAAFALEAEMDVALTRARKAIRKADAVVDFTLSPGERILALNPLTEALAPGGVLLSLALTMSLTHLATFLNRLGSPGKRSLERVVGFATLPPWQERGLIEILPGPSSSPDAVAAARGVFRALGKETAVVKDTVGGVFPRIFAMIVNEAAFALAEGVASAEAIDTALRLGANYPQGPLALADEIGLEIFLQLLEPLHEEAGEQYRPAPFLRQAVEAGRTGRTAGRGFHMYTDRND